MAFGFGGGGGFSLGGALGGLSLLGSTFLGFQAAREKAAAAREQVKDIRRQRARADVLARRDAEQRAREERRAVGTLRARLAGQGLDLSTGSARRLVNLTRAQFDRDQADADELRALEEQGFTSSLGAARRARGIAGINQFLGPSVSLIGGLGELL